MAFGCQVKYKPPPTTLEGKERRKLAPSMEDGLFLGYVLHSGGRWSGDYFVVPLDAVARMSLDHHIPQEFKVERRVTLCREVHLPERDQVLFPVKEPSRYCNNTLAGKREAFVERWKYREYGDPDEGDEPSPEDRWARIVDALQPADAVLPDGEDPREDAPPPPWH